MRMKSWTCGFAYLASAIGLIHGGMGSLAAAPLGVVVSIGQMDPPPTNTDVVAVAAGLWHGVALRNEQTVLAWGMPNGGRLMVPAGLTGVVSIAAGEAHSLALKQNGAIVGWGVNNFGQLSIPQEATNVAAIACGRQHSLAVRRDGTVLAWGYNFFGQGTAPPGLSNVVAVAGGDDHSLALRNDGTISVWGVPTGVTEAPPGLTNIKAIAAAGSHSLVLRSNGTVVAWGNGEAGQTPGPAMLSNVVAIAAGEGHSLALREDGTVFAWGDNSAGQTTVPLDVGFVSAIAGGGTYSLLLKVPSPVIVKPPLTVVTNPGSAVSFSVEATGGAPFTYQWQKDQLNIPGATSVVLNLSDVQSLDIGKYRAVVTGLGGKVLSPPAGLLLRDIGPSIAETLVLPPNMATQSMAYGDTILSNANFRMQQAYGASLFPTGALLITELRFRPDILARAFTSNIPDIQINLSTSLRSPEALSSYSWSANIGDDDTVVFRGSRLISSQFLGPPLGPKEFDIAFPLTTPFLYLPAAGNLMVDIRNYSGSTAGLVSAQLVYGDQASQASGGIGAYRGLANSSVDALQIRYVAGRTPAPPRPRSYPPDSQLIVPQNLKDEEQPFGSGTLAASGSRIQQVYGASQFPTGTLAITEMRFRPDAQQGRAFSTTISNIQIALSTATPRADGLSAIYDWNTGPDETVVYDGPLTIRSEFTGPPTGPKDFDIVVPFVRPFVFNGQAGNLLVDIKNTSGSLGASLVSGQSRIDDGCARLYGPSQAAGGTVDSGADAFLFVLGPTNASLPTMRPPTPGYVVVPWQASSTDAAFGSGTLVTSSTRVQEVYSSVNFPSGLMALTELRFRPDFQYGRQFSNTVVDIALRLSTTPRQPNELLGAALENIGLDETVVFEGPIGLSSQFAGPTNGPKAFDIVVPFTQPFLYNPDGGNLLVDITTFSGSPNASLLSGFSVWADSASRLRTGPGAGYGPSDTGAEALQFAYLPTNRPLPQPTPPLPTLDGTVQPANLLTQEMAFTSSTLSAWAYRAQQLYSAAYFPTGELLISELRFRPHGVTGSPFYSKAPMIQINISVTRRSAEALSTVYAENTGVNERLVFRSPIAFESRFEGPPGGPKTFDIRIPLTTPYLYDPSQGNLLLDLRNFGGSAACPISGQAVALDGCARVTGYLGDSFGSVDTGVDAVQFGYILTNTPSHYPAHILRGPYLQLASSTNITIRWTSDEVSEGQVRYGLQVDALNYISTDFNVTNQHLVTLSNLTPGTRYYYSVGSPEAVTVSGLGYQFVTAPVLRRPIRIWATGDVGDCAGCEQQGWVRDAYYAFTRDTRTDVWLLLGDNGCWSDAGSQLAIFNVYSNLLRCTPAWPTLGNHDVDPERVDGWTPYLDIFTLPTQGEAGGISSGSERYYSFDHGNAHFVCLDSETSDKSPGGAMLTWVERDLASNTNDWVIAFWHSPPYSRGSHDSDIEGNLIQMREWVLPVLESHGVDLVLCGHSHSYERSYLIDGHYGSSGSLTPAMVLDAGSGYPGDTGAYLKASIAPAPRQGTVYVVSGSAGNAWGAALNHPAMFKSLNRLGSTVIDIDGNRLDGRFLSESGIISDHFAIVKGGPSEPLRFATIRVTNGIVSVAWKSTAGHSYRIERSTTLNPEDWSQASDNVTATGATTYWTCASQVQGGSAFFRLKRVTP
jgi:hypothetical protein